MYLAPNVSATFFICRHRVCRSRTVKCACLLEEASLRRTVKMLCVYEGQWTLVLPWIALDGGGTSLGTAIAGRVRNMG